jgi:elongator complex protein 6
MVVLEGGGEEIGSFLFNILHIWSGEGIWLTVLFVGAQGLDLQRFVDGNRLRFVDGLSGLFDTSRQTQQLQQQSQSQQQGNIRSGPAMGSGRSIPMRGPASPRAPPFPPSSSSPLPTAGIPSSAKSSPPQQKQLHISGQGITALNQLENDILSVIQSLPKPDRTNETDEHGQGDEDGNDILLILDQPDLILATTPGIDANDMSEWVMGLQQVRFPPSPSFKDKNKGLLSLLQHVLSTIITTSADSPLIHNANPYTLTPIEDTSAAATPLEKNHASFVVGLAHRADMVLQLRTLDTGAAKDVSGVLRMSRGGGYEPEIGQEGKEDGEIAEKEVLYFVQRDGGVRVFGRGEV